jgi:FlaA1/EpsC-like NDP-sugar epimerase
MLSKTFLNQRSALLINDILLSFISISFAYLIRFDFKIQPIIVEVKPYFWISFPLFLIVKGISYYIFKIHQRRIRHTDLEDFKRFLYANFCATILFFGFNLVQYYFISNTFFLPTSVLIMDFFISYSVLIGSRFLFKLILNVNVSETKQAKSNVLIYGAGESGSLALQNINKDPSTSFNVLGFIDDNIKLNGTLLHNINVYHTSKFDELIKETKIEKLVIAIQEPDYTKQEVIVNICLNNQIQLLRVPNGIQWNNGEFKASQIKTIKIEDLLGRNSIYLDEKKVQDELNNRVILITGAAGSIGSGIVKQIARYQPKQIVLLDQAESALYDLEQELKKTLPLLNFELVIGDISNYIRMERLFDYFKPTYVFHAAAYKHVPLMEENPSEAINTNVLGTKNLVDLAVKYNIEKFVLISTDKAVNPTNVMGASKRIAEIYAQSKENNSTKFITTRFGNVLGSNGSVIPLFKKQIEEGGPITITDLEVTRYFMTIPEACQLVLEACAMGNGNEIFVFDMGESVKIIDLARKMIKLSGLEEGKDIEIKVTGLRPGEKLYEELLSEEENTIQTHHPKILIAKVRSSNMEIIEKIGYLITLYNNQNNKEIVQLMKTIVPEFISNNSEFSQLDEKQTNSL